MKKFLGSALFLGLALGLNSATYAQDNNSQTPNQDKQERAGRKNREGRNHGFESLNLTDAQKQQIQNIRQSNKNNQANREEMRKLTQARRDGTLTQDQLARLETIREQNRANAEKVQQQILAVLTPEQRQQYEQFGQRRGRNQAGDKMRDGRNRAENGEFRNQRVRGERSGNGLRDLNLTAEQKEKLRNLRGDKNSNDSARQELRELAQVRRNGGTLTAEQQNRLKTLRQQVKAEGDQREQEILSILTPEQRQKFEQNKAERKQQRRQQKQNAPIN